MANFGPGTGLMHRRGAGRPRRAGAGPRRRRADQRQQRPVGGDVDRVGPRHEPHLEQEVEQAASGAGLDVEPGGRAVVDDHRVVLDVTVRGEHQQLGALAGRQREQVLGGQVVQPGQPLRAGDRDHAAVAPVDQRRRRGSSAAARASGRRSAPRSAASVASRIERAEHDRIGHRDPRSARTRRTARHARRRSGSRARPRARRPGRRASPDGTSSTAWQLRQTRWTCVPRRRRGRSARRATGARG